MAAKFRLKYLGCACFEMDFDGFHVVSDPFMTESPTNDLTWERVEDCDLMVVTHGHYDHVTDIARLHQRFHAKLCCGEMLAPELIRWSDMSPMDVFPMACGQVLDFGPVKLRAVYGKHVRLAYDWTTLAKSLDTVPFLREHPDLVGMHRIGHLEYRNFTFILPDGRKLTIWGNGLRAPLEGVLKAEQPDILLLQTTMQTNTKTADETIRICREMGTRTVIGNHLDFPRLSWDAARGLRDAFAAQLPEVRFIVPEYDSWIEF